MLPTYQGTILRDLVICDLSKDHVHVNCWHALVLMGEVLKVVLIKTISMLAPNCIIMPYAVFLT